MAYDFTGIVAAAQLLHLLEDSAERRFCLRDGHLRVILAVLFQALMMLAKLFTKKLGQALARGTIERPRGPNDNVDGGSAL